LRAPTPEEVQRLQAAYGLVRAGRPAEARAAAAPIAANAPWISDAHHILGLALRALGEAAAAEAAFGAAVRADPNRQEHRQEWGKALTERGHGLKADGDLEGALAAYRQAAQANPKSHVAEHNAAAALADLNRHDEAAAAAQRALAKGGTAPETFLVLGDALRARGDLEQAEAAYVDAHRELAQLVWMRTGDILATLRALESALTAWPDDAGLRTVKSNILGYAGEAGAAYVAAAGSDDLGALVAAAQAALDFDPKAAVEMARRAVGQTEHRRLLTLLAQALLAAGEAEEAEAVATRLRARAPSDQNAIALQATAWRMLGDPRYRDLYDYGLVGAYEIDAPAGWSDLPSFLADLKTSLRHGSHTSGSLLASGDRTIRAFFQAIDGPIRRHLAMLGQGSDPVRARNRGDYKLSGAWSVRLQAGGLHVDRVQPEGWISGACYVDLPAAVDSAGREGWLKFGEPGVRTAPRLDAEHYVRPEPGLLVLFPSYMWHGAVPFTGQDERLTIAFDAVPK
jgi:tetratricopeptide (TPR) repeat protein